MERLEICVFGSNFKKSLKKDLGKRNFGPRSRVQSRMLNLGC